MPVEPFSREEMVVVLGLRAAGMTIDQIANELDRSYFAVRRRLQRSKAQAQENAEGNGSSLNHHAAPCGMTSTYKDDTE